MMNGSRHPQRKSPRLPAYDYSQAGAYFITICTHQREHLFGEIVQGAMHLTAYGLIAESCWFAIPSHYPDVDLDLFVVMPNHVHGILVLEGDCTKFRTVLGRVMNAYKGAVTAQVRLDNPEIVVWQGRYYDHIVRDEADLQRIQAYIENNPARWSDDSLHP